MTMQDWQELLLRKETLIIVGGFVLTVIVFVFIHRIVRKISVLFSPRIEVLDVKLFTPKPEIQHGELQFTLKNKGGGKAKVNALAIHLVASGQSTKTRDLLPPKKAPKYLLQVKLRSDRKTTDIRAIKPPNKAARPILNAREKKRYSVQLVSDEYAWYRVKLIVQWHNTRNAKSRHSLQSKEMYIEFQPS